MQRRRLLELAAATAARALLPAACVPGAARAQAPYPDRPIRLVVPFPPGALTDNIGRVLAERLRTALGQPVLIENRPGAGTLLAGSQVAKAPADGYTLMIATSTTLGIAPVLFANPPMRISDLTGVAMIGAVTLFLVARPDLPADDLAGLVRLMRAAPGRFNFASPGNGTVHHLVVEMLKTRERVFATHIPYNGSVQALTDVMSGRLDFMLVDASIVLPQLRAGKVKALAITGTRRSALAPEVPAITERYPEIDLQAWQSLAAPAATPVEVVERLNAEVNRMLATAEFRAQLAQIGVEPQPMSAAAFNERIRREAVRWTELVRRSGARVD
jgi:tripartite-type tricarboxylate transporter receptor subunit TctC